MRYPAAVALALAGALVLAVSGAALAGPKPPLGHEGRWITDTRGRVVVLHGFNLVAKGAPYLPSARGFGADDARFLASQGFNTVRLGINYAAVEPKPGVYDKRFIRAYAGDVSMLARRGIFPLADLHQDLYSEVYSGDGMPAWMAVDDGFPRELDVGFPGNYLVNPAMNRAFDNFWENADAPDGRPLQSHYAGGLRRLAARLRGVEGMLGYDIFNEPWPGTSYPTCISATAGGCPAVVGFDQTLLTDFSRRAIDAVRDRDRRHLAFYEPNLVFAFDPKTGHGEPNDRRAGFSFHNYCLAGILGGSAGNGNCPSSRTNGQAPFDNAEQHSEDTGAALLLTEFGATAELGEIDRIVELADRNLVGWQYWTYANLNVEGQTDTEISIIRNQKRPPTPDNLNQGHLNALVRAYPRVIAGTPSAWEFDRAARRFTLRYSTRGPGGRDFAGAGRSEARLGRTEIFVPARHFAGNYRVTARGAEVVARRQGGQVLILRNCRGGGEVVVEISDEGGGSAARCKPPAS